MKLSQEVGYSLVRRLGGAGWMVAGLVVVFLSLDVAPAEASLRICNKTASRVGVAVGYKDEQGWVTEGWWNMVPGACETLIEGPLAARYYYLRAVDYDRGGEWGGPYQLCAFAKVFTIRDTKDCTTRGYEQAGFFEIDTGDLSTWTVQLTDPGRSNQDQGAQKVTK